MAVTELLIHNLFLPVGHNMLESMLETYGNVIKAHVLHFLCFPFRVNPWGILAETQFSKEFIFL